VPAAASLCRPQAFNEFVYRMSEVADVDGAAELPPRKNPSIEFENVSFACADRAERAAPRSPPRAQPAGQEVDASRLAAGTAAR
jgi:hypothetical protein